MVRAVGGSVFLCRWGWGAVLVVVSGGTVAGAVVVGRGLPAGCCRGLNLLWMKAITKAKVTIENPIGPESGSYRILRGGSQNSDAPFSSLSSGSEALRELISRDASSRRFSALS